VVDSHVHLLPGRLGEKVRAYFDLGWKGRLAYPVDHDLICEQLAAEGIDEVWTLPYTHKPGIATGLNEASAATASGVTAVKVIAGATVHPGDDSPERIVRHSVEVGGARVLKLHCSVGGHRADDPRLDAVWRFVEAVRLPVVVHVGHAGSGRTEADELAPVETMALRHPQAPIVIAHCAHPNSTAALDALGRHGSLHADLTPVVADPVPIDIARMEALHDRLLFGSDAPNTVIPAGTGLAAVHSAGLSAGAVAAITGGNARRLIAAVRA